MTERSRKESLPSVNFFTSIPFPVHTFKDSKSHSFRCKGSGQFPLEEDIDLTGKVPTALCRGSCESVYPAFIGRINENNLRKGWQWSNKPLPKKPV